MYNWQTCWWWHLMEHFHNDLMKLVRSLGNNCTLSGDFLRSHTLGCLGRPTGATSTNWINW
jgi:hypothetical protein